MFELSLIALLAGIGLALLIAMIVYAKRRIDQANDLVKKSNERWKNAKRDMDNERREALLKLKDEMLKKRNDVELEMKRDRLELDRLQSKLNAKHESLEKKEHAIDEARQELQHKERSLARTEDQVRAQEAKVKGMYNELITKLERIGAMTREEAKQALFETLQAEIHLANQKWVQRAEEETRQNAKERVTQILVTAMQRYTAEQVAPHSSAVVHLQDDNMKGRIIGKEGRNIKALEMATGMEFVIDTPEIITISGFNPIRREIARRSLEGLIVDGRINPTRIEEMVGQVEKEVEEMIQEYGHQVSLEFNLQGVNPEIITLLGKLHFRTSFSQNVLMHCKEVGMFARMLAEELGLDGNMALRAGLLHDIGKAVTAEVEGPHAIIGSDIAKRCGENSCIVNAIAAHHEEVQFSSLYAPIVVIADTISASRPGARRETLAAYVKRLEKLEEIAQSFEGIKKAYALQAGREIRIIVEEDRVDDDAALLLAGKIARKVEQEMTFPGQIKVNVIREKRAIDYAR